MTRTRLNRGVFAAFVISLAVVACIFWPRTPPHPGPPELTDDQVWFPGGVFSPEPHVELDSHQKLLVSRIEEKLEIVRSLIRGETTLGQAATRFQAIHAGDSTPLAPLRVRYPRATIEELWYRHVIVYVKGLARSDPNHIPALVRKLESETAQRFFHQRKDVQPNYVPESWGAPVIVADGKRTGTRRGR